MAYIHKSLASGRWQKLSLMEQLANIGAEIGRAMSWQVKGDTMTSQRAMERGLELFDLTIADKRWRHRLKEISRMREVVCDFFYGNNQYQSTPESIDKYFLIFAFAARIRK
ncbi:MAG: hypothetical protein KGZ86_08300 [Candidatus Latescibacteria bacterium]|nr:hypothetical protein [Candidatus Latescibacterota bacterium]